MIQDEDNNTAVNRSDDCCTNASPNVSMGFFESDFDVWEDYFRIAYTALVSSPTTADWNENRLVEKAYSLANLAFATIKAQKEQL